MNILNPTLTTDSLSIHPRGFDSAVSVAIVFTNEDTSKETIIPSSDSRYISNELVLDLLTDGFSEGERYTFEVMQNTSIIFRGKAFITEFTDINYSINNQEFQIDIDTDSNELKVYE
tara:strand:+ start:655 stop:1005 length:351 start_codon:yes stop_codon:yes gene_type:complete